MEQPTDLDGAIEQMENRLKIYNNITCCDLPLATTLAVARTLRGECSARVSQDEQLYNRLQGEIVERSQRQLEITGRLAAVERRLGISRTAYVNGVHYPDGLPAAAPAPCNGQHPPPTCADPCCWHFKLADVAATLHGEFEGHSWHFALASALGIGPESRTMVGMIQDVQAKLVELADARAETERVRTRYLHKINDLETQVEATQEAICDVWKLVETRDGFGSPFWSESGLDDTTPAQAVAEVFKHLRKELSGRTEAIARHAEELASANRDRGYWRDEAVRLARSASQDEAEADRLRAQLQAMYDRMPAYDEAMAALNAADRQSDDDQICGS